MSVIEILSPMATPLAILIVALVLFRQLRHDLNPVFRSVIGGVAQNAQRNAMQYAFAMMLATLGSLQALADVSREFGWNGVEAACRVLQPGLTALVGYITKAPETFSLDSSANKKTP